MSALSRSLSNVGIVGDCGTISCVGRGFCSLGTSLTQLALSVTHHRRLTSPVDRFLNVSTINIVLMFNNSLMFGKSLDPRNFVTFITVFSRVAHPIHAFVSRFTGVGRNVTTKRHVFSVVSTRDRVRSGPNTLRLGNLGSGVRFHSVRFSCSNDHRIVSNVSFSVGHKRAITLIKPSKNNGSALDRLIPHFCSIATNSVLVSNISVHSCARRDLHTRVDIMSRSAILFGSAVRNGVTVNGTKTSRRRVIRTTQVTGTSYFVARTPRNCQAGVNSHNIGLSNNRQRHLSVTHTILGGPSVLVLSRTASTLSARDRGLIRSTLGGLLRNHASMIVTRHLDAVRGTSGVVIISRKHVTRRNARTRLVTHKKVCTGLVRLRSFRWGVPLM